MEPGQFQAVYGKVKDAALAKAIVPTVASGGTAPLVALTLASPKQMNLILLTLAYTLLGLDDEEIASRLSIKEDAISKVRSHEAFTLAKVEFGIALNSTQFDEVQMEFKKYAPEAAKQIVELSKPKAGRSEYIQLAAGKDILDRSGYVPKAVHEHKIDVDGGLRIEYVDKTVKTEDLPANVITIENGE